jgi:hypothetical protein
MGAALGWLSLELIGIPLVPVAMLFFVRVGRGHRAGVLTAAAMVVGFEAQIAWQAHIPGGAHDSNWPAAAMGLGALVLGLCANRMLGHRGSASGLRP